MDLENSNEVLPFQDANEVHRKQMMLQLQLARITLDGINDVLEIMSKTNEVEYCEGLIEGEVNLAEAIDCMALQQQNDQYIAELEQYQKETELRNLSHQLVNEVVDANRRLKLKNWVDYHTEGNMYEVSLSKKKMVEMPAIKIITDCRRPLLLCPDNDIRILSKRNFSLTNINWRNAGSDLFKDPARFLGCSHSQYERSCSYCQQEKCGERNLAHTLIKKLKTIAPDVELPDTK